METWNNYYIHVTLMQFLHYHWFLDREMFSLYHLGCFVASTRGLRECLCHTAFVIRDINICRNSYSQGRLKSRKSYHCCKCYRIQISQQNPPQNIPPSLSTLGGTIRETIHDVVARFKGVTADFSTSKLRMAEVVMDLKANCMLKWSLSLDFIRPFE